MLKSLTFFSAIMVSILANMGCKEDCVSPKGIYGDWLWERTYDNHHGITTTSEHLGYSKKLSINDFTFSQYINDSLVFESQYDLLTRTDSLHNDKNFIVFPSGSELEIHIDESQLILTETIFMFNPASYYTRL